MGMTTGIVTHGGGPAQGKTVTFYLVAYPTVPKASALTGTDGRYAIYLGAGQYLAKVDTALCTPTSIVIPAGTKIQNLSY